MCIVHAVGLHGTNTSADAKVVQALLNENLGRLIPFMPLTIDGAPGPQTQNLIAEFQRRVLHLAHPTSRVDPGSPTLRELRAGMSPGLTADKLAAIMIGARATQLNTYLQPLITMMSNNAINTPLRQAHFLAQVGHESADLVFSEEIASGEAYEGRVDLGNTEPGDGVRFKGRGLIQLTGRANYRAFGLARQRDFVTGTNNLLLATDPSLAVDVSCWFWSDRNLNPLADIDDLNAITRRINGGLNGLADRAAHLRRAKCLLVA